jgi:hypothetical protein
MMAPRRRRRLNRRRAIWARSARRMRPIRCRARRRCTAGSPVADRRGPVPIAGHADVVPFTFRQARRLAEGGWVGYERNLAKLRTAKPHTTIKYLEPDFAELFVRALAGLRPDGTADELFRGRQVGRNAAMASLVLASGLRRQEFTHLLVWEVPPLPARRTGVPVGHGIAKGGKQRTSWTSYDALAMMHEYVALERAAAVRGSAWQPAGEPLRVQQPDWDGATINGLRRPWRSLSPAERLRLVAPDGGSGLLAVQTDGSLFVDWATLFRRTSQRIRDRFDARFPIVAPHRLRHSFAMHTLERLTRAYYQQAAALVRDTDDNAGLALYLTKADPWEILQDLLGHSSVLTTQVYVAKSSRRLPSRLPRRGRTGRASAPSHPDRGPVPRLPTGDPTHRAWRTVLDRHLRARRRRPRRTPTRRSRRHGHRPAHREPATRQRRHATHRHRELLLVP